MDTVTIRTPFNIGDSAYEIHKNIKVYIRNIDIEISKGTISISYSVSQTSSSGTYHVRASGLLTMDGYKKLLEDKLSDLKD